MPNSRLDKESTSQVKVAAKLRHGSRMSGGLMGLAAIGMKLLCEPQQAQKHQREKDLQQVLKSAHNTQIKVTRDEQN